MKEEAQKIYKIFLDLNTKCLGNYEYHGHTQKCALECVNILLTHLEGSIGSSGVEYCEKLKKEIENIKYT
jgi:hypothetical protein